MATPYVTVFSSFLDKISDSYLLSMDDADLEEQLLKFLGSSIPKFRKCKVNLSERDSVKFLNDLSDEEIEILANLMVVEWLRPRINSLELLKQSLGTRDFQLYSQSSHLKELSNLRKMTLEEINYLITSYTYSSNLLDELGG